MRNSSVLRDHLISVLKALNMFQLTDWVRKKPPQKKPSVWFVTLAFALLHKEKRLFRSQQVVVFHS